MSAVRRVPGVGLVLLLGCALCAGQSLGDAARQSRQQKDTRATTAKKVYTTDDINAPTPAPGQGTKDLTGTWSFTHFDDRFQGWITLRQRLLDTNQQNYTLTLSPDGNRLDGFGEGYFLHHTNLNMTRTGDAKPATAPPSTTSTAPSAKH